MPTELEGLPHAVAGAPADAGADAVLAGLLADISGGSQRALERLYHCLAGPVFGLAFWRTGSREDACDVVQETFLRVARQRDRLAGVRRPRVWVLTIAHRLAVDATRRRARFVPDPDAELPFVQAPTSDPARCVDAARASALLRTLPPKQREVVFLHHFEGLTFAAIGAVTGVPTFTAASRYRLGIARLRRVMEVPS